jgi:hypothetical protein
MITLVLFTINSLKSKRKECKVGHFLGEMLLSNGRLEVWRDLYLLMEEKILGGEHTMEPTWIVSETLSLFCSDVLCLFSLLGRLIPL